MESIKQCGYVTPIVINTENVILAGHTRYNALIQLGYEEADCILVDGLTEEQERKFRLLDNKVAEIAEWDLEKLRLELDGLDLGDYKGFESLKKDKEKIENEPVDNSFEIEIRCPKCGEVVGTELCN